MSLPWIIAACVCALCMVIFSGGKNAVWGGVTAGAVFGLVAAVIWKFTGHGFHWLIVAKWTICGGLFGATTEIVGRLGTKRDKAS